MSRTLRLARADDSGLLQLLGQPANFVRLVAEADSFGELAVAWFLSHLPGFYPNMSRARKWGNGHAIRNGGCSASPSAEVPRVPQVLTAAAAAFVATVLEIEAKLPWPAGGPCKR